MNLGEDDKYPDVPLTCPFDPTHTHKGGRYSMERLIACRFKHPELAPLIAPCPFNTGHWIRKDELESHLEQCREFKTWICTQTDNKQPLCARPMEPVTNVFELTPTSATSLKETKVLETPKESLTGGMPEVLFEFMKLKMSKN